MQEVMLIKNGELAMKGLNRSTFEMALVKNLHTALKSVGEFDIRRAQSTIFVEPKTDDIDWDLACERISKVFGLAAFTRARLCEKKLSVILENTADYLREALEAVSTFKVEAKRADKTFPYNSPQICAMTGEYLLEKFPHLSVDVHEPEFTVMIEIRDFGAYIHAPQTPGAGGMPVGTGGRAAILISGGIDSPVAAWMMAKRGIELSGIHFASPPYTSERAEKKVLELMGKVAQYAGKVPVYIVPFTHIQEEIGAKCPEDLFTLIMRRFMMRISEKLARIHHCEALITGESVGQVASQTMTAMACTEAVCDMPIFRPLIGMDKEEIVRISRRIDTFDISIQPYEDCCTVFTPKHPRTHPKREMIEQAEQALDIDALVEEAVAGVRRVIIYP